MEDIAEEPQSEARPITNVPIRPLTDREKLLIGIIVMLVAMIAGLVIFDGGSGLFRTWERLNYATNLYTEVISIVVTLAGFAMWQSYREKHKLKKELLRNLTRNSNDAVRDAVDDLRHHGWLTGKDSLLQNADLSFANLRGADLHDANLSAVNFTEANLSQCYLLDARLRGGQLALVEAEGALLQNADLRGASLRGANLQGAILSNASLHSANFFDADLQNAQLQNTDLREAYLGNTNLCGANLRNATLTGAFFLETVICDSFTTLPDGEMWTEARWAALIEQVKLNRDDTLQTTPAQTKP